VIRNIRVTGKGEEIKIPEFLCNTEVINCLFELILNQSFEGEGAHKRMFNLEEIFDGKKMCALNIY